MKKLILSIVTIATISLSSFGQSPEGFKYQAVVRDAGNLILNNQAVGMRMTIQQGSIGGTTVYQETFTPTTNAYGLVNLEIGSGTVVSGNFTTIDWSSGPYFIETAVDVTGGTSYIVMGTSQLMSVPYALHSNTAENVVNDQINDADADPNNELQSISRSGTTVTLSNGGGTFEDSVGVYSAGAGIDITNNVISATSSGSHYVGELYGGGVVIHVDHTGQHGLIMSLDALSTSASAGTFSLPTSPWDGQTNTANAVPLSLAGSGVILCDTYAGGGFNDWYLPSRDELRIMVSNLYEINKSLENDGNPLSTIVNEGIYHTSSDKATGSGHFYYSLTVNSGYYYNNQGSATSPGIIRAFRQF